MATSESLAVSRVLYLCKAVAESSVSKINELEDTMAKQRGQISLLFSACLKLKGLIERNLPAMLKANVTETIYKESDDASVQAWSAEPLDTEERSSDQAEGLSSSSSVARMNLHYPYDYYAAILGPWSGPLVNVATCILPCWYGVHVGVGHTLS